MIVDRAIYRDGQRSGEPDTIADLSAASRDGGGIAWLGLHQPTAEELAAVAEEFDLHELAVEDTIHAHQRPKLERYGDTLFLVLRPARYIDETETVEFGEIHVFAGPWFVITVRHGAASELGRVRRAPLAAAAHPQRQSHPGDEGAERGGNRQNEEVKKISAWAAILFAPTIAGTVYGMNFEHMPELGWLLGYPMALGLMVSVSLGLYLLFKRRAWI